MGSADDCKIFNNTFSSNEYGIYLWSSSSNNIANNTFYLNGMFVYDSYNNKVTNNTVNEKPLVYLENVNDYVVEDAGQVIAINSNNITIKDLNLSYASVGVEFWNTNNSKIINNTASNNCYGIYLRYSSNNNIANNTVSNNDDGICLDDSSNNIIPATASRTTGMASFVVGVRATTSYTSTTSSTTQIRFILPLQQTSGTPSNQ